MRSTDRVSGTDRVATVIYGSLLQPVQNPEVTCTCRNLARVFHHPILLIEEEPVLLTHHPRYTQIKRFLKVVHVSSDLFVKGLSH